MVKYKGRGEYGRGEKKCKEAKEREKQGIQADCRLTEHKAHTNSPLVSTSITS